ncbi:MAG: PPC domain-containing DNA-binding protein [Bacillota bacterium]
MKYRQGNMGRAFVARVEHGDDLLEELKKLAREENIEAGVIYVIGALKEASLVVGPEECTVPPVPVWRNFNDGREILGIGTLFREDGEPIIHLHGTLGRGDTVLMGCVRKDSRVYLVAEVIILEINGSGAFKAFEEEFDLKMLNFHKK